MAEPMIAIVGSSDPVRKDELGLKDIELAKKSGEYLGRELAKKKCHILVYSSYPHLLEIDVVRGYVASNEAQPGSIHVLYPLDGDRPRFEEEARNDKLFKFKADDRPEWEVSFYQSLSEVDGVIVLGGGQSTFIAGLVALGHRKPIVACAAFGGAGRKIWKSFAGLQDLVTRDEIEIMAEQNWTPASETAEKCIRSLLNQGDRLQRKKQEIINAERQKSANVTLHAITAALVFILALVAVPITWNNTRIDYPWLLGILFASTLLAGFSGATIRVVFDWWQDKPPTTAQSVIRTGALGLIAGGIAALLFISAQLVALPEGELGVQIKQASRLVPFATGIGFISGLTLDTVFRKLLSKDVTRTKEIDSRI